jgi:tetratricopeptide (TPR) repeat protein
MLIIEKLESDNQRGFPGIESWLKDFRRRTGTIDLKASPEKQPLQDVDALMAHNPNFWQAYYEILPGDPGLALLQAGLLLAGDEATRASYAVDFARFSPGVPKEVVGAFDIVRAAAQRLQRESQAITREGVELHDRKDYSAAVKKYEQALAILPQNGWAHYELGFTRRTQLTIAAGKEPEPNGTVRINSKSIDAPEVDASFARSRQHDPLQVMAYQGTDQDVIRGCLALRKKAVPAIDRLRSASEPAVIDEALLQVAQGLQEANVHELALAVRQIVVARRKRYDPADHPFISTSLRKLAPGPATEETLKRLAGGNIAVRPLFQMEPTDASPAPGQGASPPR